MHIARFTDTAYILNWETLIKNKNKIYTLHISIELYYKYLLKTKTLKQTITTKYFWIHLEIKASHAVF